MALWYSEKKRKRQCVPGHKGNPFAKMRHWWSEKVVWVQILRIRFTAGQRGLNPM
jgi:hypothetical protein